MTRVMPRLLDVAFELLDLHRVQAMVTPGNARSSRLLARHGFRLEGVLRGYGRWRGADWDQELHALLRPEWRGRRRDGDATAGPHSSAH